MFKVDENYVIDATTKGNNARFINHCCDVSVSLKTIHVGNIVGFVSCYGSESVN